MNTIKLKYGLEDITSRIPGLFAYMEFDENHVSTVHKATDSSVGCYGKIPCSIKIPEDVELEIDGVKVVESEHTYTYRTLMVLYYQYRNNYPDNSFIQFMDTGIGRLKTPLDLHPDWDLVSEYEYYANCARLYDEYTKIDKMCESYQQIKVITGEINYELECLCDRYARMGGDEMKEWYHSMTDKANRIADEYFGYIGDEFNLEYNINIVSKENDLGILNTYMDYFDPKHTYHDGETTIYNDRSYMCVEDFNENEEYLFGSYTNYNQQGYICAEEDGHVGGWDEDDFKLINNITQLPGNDAKFVLLSEDYSQEKHPENITGTTNSVLTGFRKSKNYLDEGGLIRLPKIGEDWLWYYMVGNIGYSETVTDEFNNIEIEDGYERVTQPNIYETHLMAYGDIISSITRDKTNKTITFTYIIGAHLKAKLVDITLDDDNNSHYYYGDYEYDSDDSHGVVHTETYSYDEGGEIDSMDNDEFKEYVTHDKAPFRRENSETVVVNTYKKCTFNTWSNITTADMVVNGVAKEYSFITSEFSTKFDAEKDSLVNPTFKIDYLTGVPYSPTVKSNVRVSRGNAAAWERHIKLSEIKTFESLETYENGGFFNLR